MKDVRQGYLAQLRIICIALVGKISRATAVDSGKASGGESCGAGGEGGGRSHGVKPPKKARFTIGIDHERAYKKATQAGMYGPSSFVLTGE